MSFEEIAPDLIIVTDSVAPQSDPSNMRELTTAQGVDSFLAVGSFAESGIFRVPDGPWAFIFSLLDGQHPSDYERQVMRDFVGYERGQARKVALWVERDDLRPTIVTDAVGASSMPRLEDREVLPGGKARCFSGHQSGICGGGLVSHATTVGAAQQILNTGALLSKSGLTASASEDLAKESGYGEPPEYFEYVMFWNGDCIGPEIVARVRHLGKETLAGLTPQEMDKVQPGVRFFFDPKDLVRHPDAAWDGAHTVKIKDKLDLPRYLVALVAPKYTEDGHEFTLRAPDPVSDRIAYIDPASIAGMSAWTTAASEKAAMIGKQEHT